MSLANGTKLGPYEIIAPLGAGGMGEVYRAGDTRLDRTVAIKVVHASFTGDADRLRRFEQEARAVGALNHPNILAIYDVGDYEGSPFLVTELLEGDSLRDRLQAGPLPVRKALDYGAQIAAGLAAAHEKGIVHRDLKPENIFVTQDGRVKILDFGLAKVTSSLQSEATQTLATQDTRGQIQTEPGAILGTVGYMSPEQVRGMPADARSDIFALGTILYEMLSGERPFRGDSSVETMNAILKEDPPELVTANRSVPPALDRIVRRCMEKTPGERFQSARDLAFALEAISGSSSAHGAALLETASPKKTQKWIVPAAIALALGLLAGYLTASFAFPHSAPSAKIKFHPLNYRAEMVFNARFASDDQTVVFSAALEGNTPRLFVHRPGYPAPQPFGQPDTHLLSISSKGELAVLTGTRYISHLVLSGTLARMDLGGGAPRAVLQNIQGADWSPDGSGLAIIREMDGQSRLEYPVGNVLYQTGGYVSDLRFSPRGDQIAFFEHPFRYDDRGSLDVVDLSGHKKVLADGMVGAEGVAWANDASEIYAGAQMSDDTDYVIYAVTLTGKTKAVLAGTDNLFLFDRAKNGDLLAAGNSYNYALMSLAPGAKAEQDLSWLDGSNSPHLSEDGKEMIFTETSNDAGENYGLLLQRTDGSPVVRLGDGVGMGLSRDGAWALSMIPGPPAQLVLYPTGAGEKRILDHGNIMSYSSARLFPDGIRVLACGNETGRSPRCYIQNISGGAPTPVTPEGTSDGLISPDGKSILAVGAESKHIIFPVAGGAGQPVEWLAPNETVIDWTADSRAVLTFHRSEIPARVEKVDLATGHRTTVCELATGNRTGALQVINAAFSADGKSYAYAYLNNISHLARIEGVK
jgi:serine/threonine protein kinase/Tol biopolymer transport system component